MTTEIFENKDIKILTYFNGERKVYKIILNGAMVEISDRTKDLNEVLK